MQVNYVALLDRLIYYYKVLNIIDGRYNILKIKPYIK